MKVKLAALFILAFLPGKEFVSARLLQQQSIPILKAINQELLKQGSSCGRKTFPKDICLNAWLDGWNNRVVTCNNTEVTVLSLAQCGLISFPSAILKLLTLQKLDLSSNFLESVTPQIGNLVDLQELRLGYNKLVSVPQEINNLVNLKSLNLEGNKLELVEMSDLVNLEKLYLGGNNLASVSLANLPKLNDLQLWDWDNWNLISVSLQNLATLENLELAYHQKLQTVSFANLPALSSLYLNDNPSLVNVLFSGNFGQLKILTLAWCNLVSIPSSVFTLTALETLDVGGNQIRSLPSGINNLVNLVNLYMASNNLESVALVNLPSLSSLYLNANQELTDLSFSGNFSSLSKVDAHDTTLLSPDGIYCIGDLFSEGFLISLNTCPKKSRSPFINCDDAICTTEYFD